MKARIALVAVRWNIFKMDNYLLFVFYLGFRLCRNLIFFCNDTDDNPIQGDKYINHIIKGFVSISLSTKQM